MCSVALTKKIHVGPKIAWLTDLNEEVQWSQFLFHELTAVKAFKGIVFAAVNSWKSTEVTRLSN